MRPIYEYVVSKDIADHMKEHFYEQDYPELSKMYAWIIWQNTHISISEKHSAWREIIETMPDIEIESELWLHSFLSDYIKEEDTLISWYEDKGNTFKYEYSVRCWDRSYGGIYYWSRPAIFNSLSEVRASYTSKYTEADEVISIDVTAIDSDNTGNSMLVTYDPSMQDMLRIKTQTFESLRFDVLEKVFERMHCSFPIPFKKGDIVSYSYTNDTLYHRYSQFVFGEINPAQSMEANGFFQFGNGTIHLDRISNYMALEYYNGDTDTIWNSIKLIHDFYNSEIDITDLLNGYHKECLLAMVERIDSYSVTE